MSYGCVSSPNEDVRTEHAELPSVPGKVRGLSLLRSEPRSKGRAREIRADGQTFTHHNFTASVCEHAHTDAQPSTASARMK